MIAKQVKREQSHPMYLHAMGKYEKVESINTQNDQETTSKKWAHEKTSACFVKVFKFQENKFKIVQKNLYKVIITIIIITDFLEKSLVTMIITW